LLQISVNTTASPKCEIQPALWGAPETHLIINLVEASPRHREKL